MKFNYFIVGFILIILLSFSTRTTEAYEWKIEEEKSFIYEITDFNNELAGEIFYHPDIEDVLGLNAKIGAMYAQKLTNVEDTNDFNNDTIEGDPGWVIKGLIFGDSLTMTWTTDVVDFGDSGGPAFFEFVIRLPENPGDMGPPSELNFDGNYFSAWPPPEIGFTTDTRDLADSFVDPDTTDTFEIRQDIQPEEGEPPEEEEPPDPDELILLGLIPYTEVLFVQLALARSGVPSPSGDWLGVVEWLEIDTNGWDLTYGVEAADFPDVFKANFELVWSFSSEGVYEGVKAVVDGDIIYEIELQQSSFEFIPGFQLPILLGGVAMFLVGLIYTIMKKKLKTNIRIN